MAAHSASVSSYSAPGKVFVLGEYAVLAGMPALVASVGPRFGLRVQLPAVETGLGPVTRSIEGSSWAVAPQSPVGRLLDWAGRVDSEEVPDFDFADPFDGAGGFGASTAQFALAYRALAERGGWDKSWSAVWKLYRELMTSKSEAVPPSGADLAVQWQGSVSLFDGPGQELEDLWETGFDWSSLMVLSATKQPGRKVATHTHLSSLLEGRGLAAFDELKGPLQDGIKAVRQRDRVGLGRAMGRYADVLRGLGLEMEATSRDRSELGKIQGVLGVKGAGALQADALLVLVDPLMSGAREAVRGLAAQRKLEMLCDGLSRQDGVVCEE